MGEALPPVRRKGSLLRWAERVFLGTVALLALLYGGDWSVFALRGRPTDRILVNSYLAVPLKGNKTEFDFQGAQAAPCARAIFPQSGMPPCWYLRRHTTQSTNL
jgi:hypothetical protein